MFNVFRTHQRPLLIAMTAVAILAFIWLYNPADLEKLQSNNAGTIYGREVKVFEVQQYGKQAQLAQGLGMYDLLQSLSYGMVRQDEGGLAVQFAWNSIIIDTEAEKLGIAVTDQEVIAAIKEMPAFSNNGVYDPNRYSQFIVNYVTPSGLSQSQLDGLVRTNLRLKKLKALIEAPVLLSDREIEAEYARVRQKVKLQAVNISAEELKKDVVITEEEIKKAYDEKAATLQEPAQREVEFVSFPMTEEQKKLAGKEKVAVLKALRTQAEEFAQKMVAPGADFAKVTAELNLKAQDAGLVVEGQSSDKLPKGEGVDGAVSRLSEADPNSDVLQGTNEFYVLHLKSIKPARQKTLEESKKDLTEELTQTKAKELAQKKAEEIRAKLEADLKAGKSFADAAAAANVKVIDIAGISRSEPDMANPVSTAFMSPKATFKPKELTAVLEAMDGFAIGYVLELLPVDRAKYNEEREMVVMQLSNQKRETLFQEWLAKARDAAGLVSRFG